MEERKKRLGELKKKQESYETRLLQLYKSLGQEALASGLFQDNSCMDERTEYNRLYREQGALNERVEKLKTLLETERAVKADHTKLLHSIKVDERDLALQEIALGVSVLASSLVPESIFALKQQYEALIHQLEETEDHIALVEQEESKDFFSFIGKQTRKLVLTASRSGKEREIKKLSQKAGELLLQTELGDYELQEESASLMKLAGETLERLHGERAELAELNQSLEALRTEMQELGLKDSPPRALKSLERQYQRIIAELDMLFERMGEKLARSDAASLTPEGQDLLHEIHLVQADLASIGRNIEILTTELRIAQLQKEISKLKETIRVHDERQKREGQIIADAQQKISELSETIQQLQRVLE
jgi:chromosome segregation ATPase